MMHDDDDDDDDDGNGGGGECVRGEIVGELPLKHSAMILVKKNQCLIRKGPMLTLHYELVTLRVCVCVCASVCVCV